MSYKILKTISMDLTFASINRAIVEVNRFKRELERMCEDLARNLTKEGIEIAKMQVVSMDAWFTGELEDSIKGVYFAEEHCGVIYTDCPHALFVEYGTGIVGADNPHPEAAEAEWDYDVNGHGEQGWWYPAPFGWYIPRKTTSQYAWTKGMPSRPFMYNTMRWIEEAAEREGIKMFRGYAK